MKLITKVGMVKKGDRLFLDTCYGYFVAHAKVICFKGSDTEEVVIHKGENHYFIMDMLFRGKSWVAEAFLLERSEKVITKYKYYKRGNGIKNLNKREK